MSPQRTINKDSKKKKCTKISIVTPTIGEMIAAPILKGNNNQAEYKPNNIHNGQNNARQDDNRNPNYKGHGIPVCPQVNKLISDGNTAFSLWSNN